VEFNSRSIEAEISPENYKKGIKNGKCISYGFSGEPV
jgi:hypothetical protein